MAKLPDVSGTRVASKPASGATTPQPAEREEEKAETLGSTSGQRVNFFSLSNNTLPNGGPNHSTQPELAQNVSFERVDEKVDAAESAKDKKV